MPSSINKTAALAVIGILFASFSGSVCLAEAPTRKRHLRSVSGGTRTLNDKDGPLLPKREFELEELNPKETQVAIGAEAPSEKDRDEPLLPQREVELKDLSPPGEKDVKVAIGAEHSKSDDAGDDADVETKSDEKDVKVAIGAEHSKSDDAGDDADVETKSDEKDVKVAIAAEIDEVVDDASFVIRGHPKRSCAWLSTRKKTAIEKRCNSKAFKENSRGGVKPKVYAFCRATCCAAGINHACATVGR